MHQSFIFKLFPGLPFEVNALITKHYYSKVIEEKESLKIYYLVVCDICAILLDFYQDFLLEDGERMYEPEIHQRLLADKMNRIVDDLQKVPLLKELGHLETFYFFIASIPFENTEFVLIMKHAIAADNIQSLEIKADQIRQFSYLIHTRHLEEDKEWYVNNLNLQRTTLDYLIDRQFKLKYGCVIDYTRNMNPTIYGY